MLRRRPHGLVAVRAGMAGVAGDVAFGILIYWVSGGRAGVGNAVDTIVVVGGYRVSALTGTPLL